MYDIEIDLKRLYIIIKVGKVYLRLTPIYDQFNQITIRTGRSRAA